MDAGWTIVSRGDAVEFRLAEGNFRGRAPLISFARVGDRAAALMGRLYYRAERLGEIAGRVPEPLASRCETDDAALVLATYLRSGAAAVERLEGDFSLVIWDGPARQVLAARDPLGGFPLFWTRHAEGVAMGTAMGPILALRPGRELDRNYLADFLMLPGQVQEIDTERTAYEGLYRVRAGHFVAAEVATGRVESRPYWDWVAKIDDPGKDDFGPVADGYGDRLRAAVAERARGRVSAHLSGGMDSTTTALLADECVGRGAGVGPLQTITLVHERLPGLTGERPYIDAAVGRLRHAVAHRVVADEFLDYDCFADAPHHDEPYVGLSRLGLDRATITAAVGCGADTLLTGIGADEMLVMSPFYITDMIRRGRLLQAWSEVRHWARVDNCSPWTLLHPYAVCNLLPAWARGGLAVALRGGHAAWAGQNEWTIAPWVRRDFARRYDLRGRSIAFARPLHDLSRPIGLSFGLYLIASRLGDVDRWVLGTPRGLTIAHPFLDTRVLRYGLGMGLRLQPRPEGQKPVLAHAMRDVLPQEIVNRRLKCNFSKVTYLGLSRNLPALEGLVRSTRLEGLGLIRRDVLLDCLQQAALGVSGGVDGMHKLHLTLALIKWLAMEETRTAAVRPLAVA